MLKVGGGVAVASRAPNAGEAAPKPPKDATAGAAGEAAGAPKANGALKLGVVGAAKLNPVFVAGGVGVAVELPKPPNTGAADAAGTVVFVDPNIAVAGAAPKPVAAGDEVPNAGAVEPKLKPVDVLGVGVPPDPKLPTLVAGPAVLDEVLLGAPKLNDGTG